MSLLSIETLGSQGEGVAELDGRKVFVPFTLPGERVEADVAGERGALVRIETASPDRITPICEHFGSCGGCSLQHAAPALYRNFKRDQVIHALRSRGFTDDGIVGELVAVPPGTRRRASFAATRRDDDVIFGYHIGHSHTVIAIDQCPVLRPAIVAALSKLRELMAVLLARRATAEVHVTETREGLDVAVTGAGTGINAARRSVLGAWLAGSPGFVRLNVDGEQVAAKLTPTVTFSGHAVTLPPASFLQAVPEAEAALLGQIRGALAGLKAKDKVADLFAGLGAFTLPLAARNEVLAVEWDRDAVAALAAAARQPGLRKIEVLRRDLFREPLSANELKGLAAVVFDPPRAGAQAQAAALAGSSVPTVIAVSCNAATLARDARTLVDGGYTLEKVTPVDQFLYSPHVEAVAVFRRPKARRSA